jgi:hypothetical protein
MLSEPPTERIKWVVERLALSPQQQHGIARGMSVFKRLLTPVLEELRQMQQQQVDECATPPATEPTTSGGSCSSGASEVQQYIVSTDRGRMLEQQQKRSGRMQRLLHKVIAVLKMRAVLAVLSGAGVARWRTQKQQQCCAQLARLVGFRSLRVNLHGSTCAS